MPDTSTAERRLRLCSECGGLDDHPRHVQIVGDAPDAIPSSEFVDSLRDGIPAHALAELLRPGVVVRHIDCCAAKGCVVCLATEQVTAGQRGQELIDAIANGALEGFEPPEVTSNKETGLDG